MPPHHPPGPPRRAPVLLASRATDGTRLLVQVIASVWDSILQRPRTAGESQDGLPLICGRIRISGKGARGDHDPPERAD
jgi:hypothetical protein